MFNKTSWSIVLLLRINISIDSGKLYKSSLFKFEFVRFRYFKFFNFLSFDELILENQHLINLVSVYFQKALIIGLIVLSQNLNHHI